MKTVLSSGERAKNARSISCLHYGNIIWLPWQRPLTNWKIRYRHHLSIKGFHMVKRLRKSVQCVWRYLTKYTKPRREHATQFPSFSLFSTETTGPIFTKILHDVGLVVLVALLNHAYTLRYPIPFLNARATKVRSLPFSRKLVAMATSFEISQKEVQIVHLYPKRFHLMKRLWKSVSVSGDIWQNTPNRGMV